ncbi:MAG: Mn-containing catalase [Clostridiales bacterium]|nr:Mn-containing catalase [Clostridiales bacterium]
MFVYEKKLQYPVRITRPDPRMAMAIISQYGGPDGELAASLRYLSQRFAMPNKQIQGLLTDIGVEELGHLEIVGAMVYQLTRGMCESDLKKGGFDAYFTDHSLGVFPQSAGGHPFTSAYIGVKGDPITELHEDLAADGASL